MAPKRNLNFMIGNVGEKSKLLIIKLNFLLFIHICILMLLFTSLTVCNNHPLLPDWNVIPALRNKILVSQFNLVPAVD